LIRQGFDQVWKGLLGLAAIAGLIGAFVQLDRSSLWYDELFTAWVTTQSSDPVQVWQRITMDLHPPLYYFSTYLWSLLFGTGDAGLRSYSAVCAVAAIAVMWVTLRPVIGLPGRLVMAGLAAGSREWFYMAQNARSYALCLLLGAVLLWLGVELPRDRGARKWPLIGLGVAAFIGAFSHFFMTFEAVGLCLVLALYVPRRRIALLGLAAGLVAANALYLKAVIEPDARFSVTHTWMSRNAGAYADNLLDSLKFLGLKEVAVLALLGWSGLWLWRAGRAAVNRARGRATGTVLARWAAWWRAIEPFTVICWSVPGLVLVFSIASAVLIRPNFTPQNFLVCAPFVWAGCGRLYERWMTRAGPRSAVAIQVAVGLFVLSMAPVVLGRFVERNEPWKESAEGIRGFEACRDQLIAVVSEDGPWLRDPKFPGDYQAFLYGRYLRGFAPTFTIEHRDVAEGRLDGPTRALLRQRLDGGGCPVLAWGAHTGENHYADTLGKQITAAAGPPAPGYSLAKLEYPFYDKVLMGKTTGNPGFIVYVRRDTQFQSNNLVRRFGP